ncbi:MAG: hypothetical protein GY708_05125 [Actinomycetia bacterium]|nr:hypothetical protein [Actinomycetes bacterium]MCP4959471.1 hypothetical protein [Actinomycetes bacterium]
MIDIIFGDELRALAEVQGEWCVSIYLPTHRVGAEKVQDPTRLKNLTRAATRELEELGLRRPLAESMMAPIVSLETDGRFWEHVDEGLAVFVNDQDYTLLRVPRPVEELAVVADRFHLKPLLPLVASADSFYVLVLGEKQVRLLHGSRQGLSDVASGDVPHSLAETLRYDDHEAQLQSHASSRIGTGRVSATFHGHGVGKDTKANDRERFFTIVDSSVRKLLAESKAPVVLAGVADTVARYRRVSKLPNLLDQIVEGSVETASEMELHIRSWAIVDPLFDKGASEARGAFVAGSRPSLDAVADVVQAALSGKVESLFVPVGVHSWGRLNPDDTSVDVHDDRRPGDRDLLDVAAIETLARGGSVFAVDPADVPGQGPLAAALRY